MSTESGRLSVKKTYKLYVAGAFVRSESGRVASPPSPKGNGSLDNFSLASRKDFRDAVTSSRSAQPGWASRSAFLRSQILYRTAEMLEARVSQFTRELSRVTGGEERESSAEVLSAIDRLVYYAGWADKLGQVFGAVNAVASPHLNVSSLCPMGVVAAMLPARPSLLALATAVGAITVMGNSLIVLAPPEAALPVLSFAEVLAVSDYPVGVVNLLAGDHAELAPHVASHMDVNAILDLAGNPLLSKDLQRGAVHNMKRYSTRGWNPAQFASSDAETPDLALDFMETKTSWQPVGY